MKKVDECLHSLIHPSIKRLESEKYEYVFTYKTKKDFFVDIVNEEECDASGIDQLDKADSRMS